MLREFLPLGAFPDCLRQMIVAPLVWTKKTQCSLMTADLFLASRFN